MHPHTHSVHIDLFEYQLFKKTSKSSAHTYIIKIHNFVLYNNLHVSIPVSPGLGGAVGYMLGGLDWTGTALGRAFKSQEQVLFLFAGIIFIISVTLHMLSIPEQPFAPSNHLKVTGSGESTSQLSFRPIGHTPPLLDVIAEEDASAPLSREDNEWDPEEGEMDFLAVERVRSKSDSVLAMPDATIELDSDLEPDAQLFLPEVHHFLPRTQGELEDVFKPSDHSIGSLSPSGRPPALTDGIVAHEPTDPAWPEGPTNSPPSLLQINSGSEDSHLKTQVKSTATVADVIFVGLKLHCQNRHKCHQVSVSIIYLI